MLRDEALAGCTVSNVTSPLLKLIRECKQDNRVWLWNGNCIGQNENWFLLTGLVECGNYRERESVTITYLEKEHTFMANYGINGNIGNLFRKN